MEENANIEVKQPNIVSRLWSGDVPLATVFWGFILIPGLFFKGIQFGFDTEYYARGPTDGYIASAITYLLLANAYMLFMLFALWRSAGNHPESGFWCYVARAYAGLNGAFLLWKLAPLFGI